MEKANRVVSNYMLGRDVGLPALNLKQARINKALDSIRKRAQGDSVTTNRDLSKDNTSSQREQYYVRKQDDPKLRFLKQL